MIGGSGAAFNFCIPELHSINEATRQEYRSLGKAKKNMQKALAWEEIAEDIHAIQIETSGWVKHHNEWESKLIHGFRYPDAAKLTVMHAVQLYVMQIAMRCKAYIDRPTDGCEPESEEEDAILRKNYCFGMEFSDEEMAQLYLRMDNKSEPKRYNAMNEYYRRQLELIARWWKEMRCKAEAFSRVKKFSYDVGMMKAAKRFKANVEALGA